MVLIALTSAMAGTTITGGYLQVNYSDSGVWNWDAVQQGLQIRTSLLDDYVDVTYPITPWVAFTVEYDDGAPQKFRNTTYGTIVTEMTPISATDRSFGSFNIYQVRYAAGDVEIVRSEVWSDVSQSMLVFLAVHNVGNTPLVNFRMQVAIDPDQDVEPYGPTTCVVANQECSFHEYCDLVDLNGDGDKEFARSSGYYSDMTIGFGTCRNAQEVGHTNFVSDADGAYLDQNGALWDYTLHWRGSDGVLQPDEYYGEAFVVAFDDSAAGAEAVYVADQGLWCNLADGDGDGHWDDFFGGDDCDDLDPNINPGVPEIPNDGIDQDCDGFDLTTSTCFADQDGDGFGGTNTVQSLDNDCNDPGESNTNNDCNDNNNTIYPGAPELPNDGIDQDCNGSDLIINTNPDTDGDGLTDDDEIAIYNTDPNDPDSDDDGLTDGQEVLIYTTDPNDPDTDNDGLEDGPEVFTHQTQPTNPDTDGDSLLDGEEVNTHDTDPNDPDSDDDGLTDGREVNLTETDPNDRDSDDDNLTDGQEVDLTDTDPNDADSDDDGLNDYREVEETGTDPNDADTDDDGLLDGREVEETTTNPHDPDSDDDGLLDGREVDVTLTDPLNPDTDGDGMDDGTEVDVGADPLDRDTDDDGIEDGPDGLGDIDDDGVINVLDPFEEEPPVIRQTLPTGGCVGGCSSSSSGALGWLALPLASLLLRRRA